MPTELERIEMLEREVAALQAKVTSIEDDLAVVPSLITTGFRQIRSEMAAFRAHVDSEMTAFRAHVDQRFDATVRAVAEIVKEGKSP